MPRRILAALVLLLAQTAPAAAQIDPMLFIKDTAPHVLFVVDTSVRLSNDSDRYPSGWLFHRRWGHRPIAGCR